VLLLRETPLKTHTGNVPAEAPESRRAGPAIERTQHA
jgi:hypothetical protein